MCVCKSACLCVPVNWRLEQLHSPDLTAGSSQVLGFLITKPRIAH